MKDIPGDSKISLGELFGQGERGEVDLTVVQAVGKWTAPVILAFMWYELIVAQAE